MISLWWDIVSNPWVHFIVIIGQLQFAWFGFPGEIISMNVMQNCMPPNKWPNIQTNVDSVQNTQIIWYVKSIEYHKTSKIRCTLVGNKIIDHSDVVGA